MKQILLDTNFLIYCAKQRVDYIEGIEKLMTEDYKVIILSPVLDELKNFAGKVKKRKDKDDAELALKMVKEYILRGRVKLQEEKGKPDETMKRIAGENRGVILATADRELKDSVRKKAQILAIKQGKYLIIA